MADGKKVRIETYNPEGYNESARKKVPVTFHEFGLEQNKYNRIVVNRLRRVESENRELNLELQRQSEHYEQLLQEKDEQYAILQGQVDILGREISRLKLTAKLNSNSIDRLIKKIPQSIDIDIDED
jgi:hypothetical protein